MTDNREPLSREEQIILCQDILLGEPAVRRGGVWLTEPGHDGPIMGFMLTIGRHNIGGGGYNGVFATVGHALEWADRTKQSARALLLKMERETTRQGVFVHNEIAVAPGAAFEHIASEHCPCRPRFIDANDTQSTAEYFGRSPTGYDS